jgi:hypothetical protein
MRIWPFYVLCAVTGVFAVLVLLRKVRLDSRMGVFAWMSESEPKAASAFGLSLLIAQLVNAAYFSMGSAALWRYGSLYLTTLILAYLATLLYIKFSSRNSGGR